MTTPKNEKKVKAWAIIRDDGIIERWNADLLVMPTERAAGMHECLQKRQGTFVTPCTIIISLPPKKKTV